MPRTPGEFQAQAEEIFAHLSQKKKVLFLTTSNRWSGEKTGERPKSTRLAYHWAEKLGQDKVTLLEVPRMNIAPCEGNVSTARGNTCGVPGAVLGDAEKNPTGLHRCWASLNNPDDELWKISKELFQSDTVLFFGSVRWGQMNSHYQKLIERLTWIENRHSTLGEDNPVKNTEAGLIVIGHNWNGESILDTQKKVLEYFGFQVPEKLSFHWQYTTPEDESQVSYTAAVAAFEQTFF